MITKINTLVEIVDGKTSEHKVCFISAFSDGETHRLTAYSNPETYHNFNFPNKKELEVIINTFESSNGLTPWSGEENTRSYIEFSGLYKPDCDQAEGSTRK